MDLAGLAAQCGVTPNADGAIDTQCLKCGGKALLWVAQTTGKLWARCEDQCGKLDPGTLLDALADDFAARQVRREPGDEPGIPPEPEHPPYRGNGGGNGHVVKLEDDPKQALLSWQLELSYGIKQSLIKPTIKNWLETDPASLRLHMVESLKTNGPARPPAVRALSDAAIEDAIFGVVSAYVPLPAPEPVVLELPDLTKKDLEPLKWGEMRARRAAQNREWIVEGKLARRETSSWSGKVEAGKTTLMRELTLCILRGEPFLGCETHQGRVAYIMLDADGEDGTFDAFEALGFTEQDGQNTLFLFEPMMAQMERGLEKLVKMLLDFQPSLVIVDPYPRLKEISDFHSYSNTYLMALLSHVAKLTNAHFALPGHIPRGRDDDADTATAGFGSIAFSGGVNARFKVINRNGTHTISSSKGKGGGFVPFESESTLVEDTVTKRITLGGAWSWKDKARSFQDKVLEFLDDHSDRPFDVATLGKELRIQRSVLRAAANMLFGGQKIRRDGEGLKTDPYIFASLGYGGEMTLEAVKRD